MDIFRKVEGGLEALFGGEKHSHTHPGEACHDFHPNQDHRFQSFAPQTSGNCKYHIDGAAYFWAVSIALEEARESIYILDWWLSPELYLRRPPARYEEYRLDRMLQAAAERGVRVNIIVYKEVPQALTLDSAHTKHALEALHPNIRVFRHPDHHLSGYDIKSDIETGFKNLSLGTFDLSKLSHDTLKTLYGTSDDVVLFWAHHEKLCIIDGTLAFMGGLDMCFGRWDTNSHPIADAHPGNLDNIIFPGQDFNNARVYDFEDVGKWEQNKLDRTKSSRMGWSDISISLSGPIVQSLLIHFSDRWNYIFKQKYSVKDEGEYQMIEAPQAHAPPSENLFGGQAGRVFSGLHEHFNRQMRRFVGGGDGEEDTREPQPDHDMHIQLTRSCTAWSSGHPTEHSIANAYIDVITNAQHFVYIENQFFITATDEKQMPVANKIGAAIVNRIVRAWQNGEDFRVIVLMPAVPAFAGDLKSDGALGTRAIMEFQYASISRGGHSIMEALAQAGVPDPQQYISFYNLRNFDRINTSTTMDDAQRASGVSYESARREFDDAYQAGDDGGRAPRESYDRLGDQYQRYQDAAGQLDDATWDTISACYMDNGPDLRSVPWDGSPEAEMDAFVSEELYIHSKVLIADDRVVICGSANLNDRSQLGTHDSEIAVVIEDPAPVRSRMAGRDWTASRFAAGLRRQLFRKHLGLLPNQRPDRPGRGWTPVTRDPDGGYDWGSPADRLVEDPLSGEFADLWRGTARRNTEVFSRAFHNVPNDAVRTWADYDAFFSRHFVMPGAKDEDKDKDDNGPARVDYGHVVRDEFPGGVDELKEWLGRARGTLVEMPLDFLVDVADIAKEGLELNGLTDELYT